uniref:Uncharacterized protein n=1 Tax=Glossina austeni TaxID=7395 RepID=A0A1A9VES7_GLOAU
MSGVKFTNGHKNEQLIYCVQLISCKKALNAFNSTCSLHNKCNKSKIYSCKQTNTRVQQKFLKSCTMRNKNICFGLNHTAANPLANTAEQPYLQMHAGLSDNEKQQPVSTFMQVRVPCQSEKGLFLVNYLVSCASNSQSRKVLESVNLDLNEKCFHIFHLKHCEQKIPSAIKDWKKLHY